MIEDPTESTSPLAERAESLARQGRFPEARELFRQVVGPAPAGAAALLSCPVCGGTEHEPVWVGLGEPCPGLDPLRTWARCGICRAARVLSPAGEEAALQARAERLEREGAPGRERLHQALRDHDELVGMIREEGYGLSWLSRGTNPRPHLLEVGSGYGAFLAAAGWRGFEASGVEPAAGPAGWARENLGVVVWDDIPGGLFDVIVLRELLCQRADPAVLLSHLVPSLVSEGLLVLALPSRDHPLHRAQGYDDPRWSHPEHTVWFDRKSLTLMLLRLGVQPVQAAYCAQDPGSIVIVGRKE